MWQKLCACDVAKGMNTPPTFLAGVFNTFNNFFVFYFFFVRSIELD